MRMENIPRGLKKEDSVAEPLELGAGMKDRKINHVGPTPNYMVENETEREWFTENAEEFDPRLARSDYHDKKSISSTLNKRSKKQIEKVDLCEGNIENVIMYPGGAHITINNDTDIFFVFVEDVNFVIKDTKVKVIDNITKITHPYETYIGSGELSVEENHFLTVIGIDDVENDEN